MKVVLCTIILVITSNFIRKITLNMLCSVPCYEVHNLNKLAMKVVLCTIIVVITSNLIRKITLNMLCSVPCYEVQQIFFSGSPCEGVGL